MMNERDIKTIQCDTGANSAVESRKRPYWKLAVFLLSLVMPGYIVSMFAWGILCGLLDIRVLDRVNAETAAAYEHPVRRTRAAAVRKVRFERV